MHPVFHSEACQARQDALKEYLRQWPHAHEKCYGTGVVLSKGDSVPYGSTNVLMGAGEPEPCSCQDSGKCPRCGADIVWHDDADAAHLAKDWIYGYFDPCPVCGIVSGEVSDADMMPQVECDCSDETF